MQTQVRDILQGEYFMLLRFIFIGTDKYKGNSSSFNHSKKVVSLMLLCCCTVLHWIANSILCQTINHRSLQRGEIRCSDIREMQLQTTVPHRQSTIGHYKGGRGEIRCSDIREMQLHTTVPQTLWRGASFEDTRQYGQLWDIRSMWGSLCLI